MHDMPGILPEWAVAELRRPVVTSAAERERIMELVRARAAAGASMVRRADRARAGIADRYGASSSGARSSARRGNWLRSRAVLAALAAGIAAIIWGTGLLRQAPPANAGFTGMTAGRATVIGDSIDSALHDTLRLVRFVLEAPEAARVALVGDFNDWSRTATPLVAATPEGAWSVVVAVPPGRRRYAFVVDDTQWVSAPAPSDQRGSGAWQRPGAPAGGDST